MRSAAAIRLSIPDNEARTAFSTLRRLGCEISTLDRADLWIAEESIDSDHFLEAMQSDESIYNENKHTIIARPNADVLPGEAWVIDDLPHEAMIRNVGSARRVTLWMLRDAYGRPASRLLISEALDMLLCNPAFQRHVAQADDVFADTSAPRRA